jgi:mannose-1-phosphate guanylyltransferase/phosphomannomutase
MKRMKAVIMAGGEGTRLRPLTCGRPKPMVPVVNKPVMEHIIELLLKHHIKDVAVTLQYLPDLIREYFDDGNAFGMKLKYYVEPKPLGTAGSVKNAEEFLDDTFLVISGDALTDIDLGKAVAFHKEKGAMATLVLKRVDIPLEYGVVVTDSSGRIVRFLEKPSWGEVFSDTVNTGIYILSPEIFRYIKSDAPFDFSKDLFPVLMKENKPLYGYITEEYWCDIGDISAYMQANMDVLNGKAKVAIAGREIARGVWVGRDTVVEEGVHFEAPCIIGSGCHIGPDTKIGRFTVIGDNNLVSGQCSIKRSIIWRNCSINPDVQLRGNIVCNHVHLKRGMSAYEHSVIGDYSIIGEHATIRPGVKIWPDKTVGQGMEVNSNLVWGSRIGRQLFGNRGVAGEINTEITPEFAARLGAAYGAVNGNKGVIGISCDDSPAAMMIMSAFLSGILSSGVLVNDFGRLLLPAMRMAVRFYRLDGGVHISTCAGASSRMMIDFFDRKGSNIDRAMEKKVENVFIRDDFNRCGEDCLKSVKKINGFNEFYLKNILNSVKTSRMEYKIALCAGSPFIGGMITNMLEELGCTVEQYCGEAQFEQLSGVGQFCSHVRHGRFDLGVSIEESCEKLMLVDAGGRLITDDMFIALISIVLFKSVKGRTVVVPVSASGAVDKLADRFEGRVVRTKTAARDIMGRLLGRDAKEELLEQFTMHFDAVAGLVKLLDFMAANRITLAGLADMIPEIHMHRQEVECSWDAKGKVIRRLIQENTGGKVETLEGVKVYNDNGWVLVLPDAEKPVCNVIGEGVSAEFAEELTNIYARKVREISRS